MILFFRQDFSSQAKEKMYYKYPLTSFRKKNCVPTLPINKRYKIGFTIITTVATVHCSLCGIVALNDLMSLRMSTNTRVPVNITDECKKHFFVIMLFIQFNTALKSAERDLLSSTTEHHPHIKTMVF